MSTAALELLPGGRPDRLAWEAMLRAAVAAEFQVEVYHPVAGDRVLYGPTCAVSGCPGRGANRSLGLKAKGVEPLDRDAVPRLFVPGACGDVAS